MGNSVSLTMRTLMRLHDLSGQRKCLTPAERRDFLRAACAAPPEVRTFCEMLAFTGCRISEAIRLPGTSIDPAAGVIVFESLKKLRTGIYRAVPVPPEFLPRLSRVHDLAAVGERRIWNWSRTTAWRRVKEVMDAAGIHGLSLPQIPSRRQRGGYGLHVSAASLERSRNRLTRCVLSPHCSEELAQLPQGQERRRRLRRQLRRRAARTGDEVRRLAVSQQRLRIPLSARASVLASP